MSELILGWPYEKKAEAVRRKFKANKTSMRMDLSHAISYNQEGHLVTFAPTGSGKGVSVIIPNLLHYEGPVITIDPKGENFAITARYRKEVLDQRIFLLDPFKVIGDDILSDIGIERSCLNPLDFVSSEESQLETQLIMLASLISHSSRTSASGSKSDIGDFWHNEAQSIISGALGLTITEARIEMQAPTFRKFINYLYSDDVTYNLAVKLDTIGKQLPTSTYQAIAAFLQKADKERSGVLSTAHSYLNTLKPESLNFYLNSSTIAPSDLLSSSDYTIYLVIPPTKLISHSLLLKLWVSSMLTKIMERTGTTEKRTLFLLDECAQLGALDGLRKAVTLLRGYGLQVWMFFQDLTQLSSLYPDDYKTLINNCGVFQAFGISRISNAIPIFEILGKYEPPELVELDKTQQIVQIANSKPEIIKLFNYRKDAAFSWLYDDNPFHNGKYNNVNAQPFPTNFMKLKI